MPDLAGQLPSALRANARFERLGDHASIPALLVHPSWEDGPPAPVVIWMHGRTVNKELDPGRYLRWMRSSGGGGGIGACAVDLPGHGERHDPALQTPEAAFDVAVQMIEEIDTIVESLAAFPFDISRIGIGGMSLGGMAALSRMATRPHPFRCASVEATTGSWEHQRHRSMFTSRTQSEIDALDPVMHLDTWREIPLQAIHALEDEWMNIEGQTEFLEALRRRYSDPNLVDFIIYEKTGAPHEHIGFGRYASDAKARQTAFFQRWLGRTSGARV